MFYVCVSGFCPKYVAGIDCFFIAIGGFYFRACFAASGNLAVAAVTTAADSTITASPRTLTTAAGFTTTANLAATAAYAASDAAFQNFLDISE